jgi:PKD repeat protein
MWETGLYAAGAYPPDANFSGDKFFGCPGLGVQYSDYSAGNPTTWSWVFQGGSPSTSNAQNPFVAYNTPGTYSVSLTVTNANGSDTQVFTNYVTVSSSPNAAPSGTGKNFCGPSTVTLNATPSAPGTIRWWNQPAGGSIVGTGNSYTTPSITGTTTYYADEAFTGGNVDFVGELDKTIGGGAMFSASDIRGLYFDVASPVIIKSVQVYASSTGIRTIEIVDKNGSLVTDTTLSIPASATVPATVNINRTVYPGTDYFIKFRGLVDCYRNQAGAVYPYVASTTPSPVTVTGSNAGQAGYYYFFYNWQFQNIVCNTGRTAITATDTCSVIGINDLFASNHIDVYPNPSNGEFTTSFHADNSDNYTVKISNEIGQTVYEERLDNFSGTYSKKIDISSNRKGVYLLSVSNSKNETVKKVLVY